MRLTLMAASATLVLGVLACSQASEKDRVESVDTSTFDNGGGGAVPDNVQSVTIPLAAADFASTVAASDMFEIQSGKLAETRARSAAIRDFGAMLVKQHTQSSADLKAAASSAAPSVAVPTVLPAEQEAKLTALKAANGAEFDRIFVQQQLEAHQKALDVLTAYAAAGDTTSLRDFASKTVAVVQAHLDKVRTLKG